MLTPIMREVLNLIFQSCLPDAQAWLSRREEQIRPNKYSMHAPETSLFV